MELPLKYQFKISRKAISYLIVEVTKATVNGTMVTAATEEWENISTKFMQKRSLLNGMGAGDGRHIVIKQPKNSGLHYRNYKGTDSIILLRMIGPEYEFSYVNVWMNG